MTDYKEVLELCKKGNLDLSYLQYAANLLPEPERTNELTKILRECVEKGWLTEAQETAALLPEPARTEGLTKILREYVEKGSLTDAREIADLIFRTAPGVCCP